MKPVYKLLALAAIIASGIRFHVLLSENITVVPGNVGLGAICVGHIVALLFTAGWCVDSKDSQ